MVDLDSLTMTIVAGSGAEGSQIGSTALNTELSYPSAVAVAVDQTLYIADTDNFRIVTVIGGRASVFIGIDGNITAALNKPTGVCLDRSNQLFITSDSISDLNMVNLLFSRDQPALLIRVFMETAVFAHGLPSDSVAIGGLHGCFATPDNSLLLTDWLLNVVWKLEPDVTAFVVNSVVGYVSGVVLPAVSVHLTDIWNVWSDSIGNLYLVDHYQHQVHMVFADGSGETLIKVFAGTRVNTFTYDGIDASVAALSGPRAVVGDTNGAIYIAEFEGHRIRKVVSSVITTFAGVGTYPGSNTVTSIDGQEANSTAIANPSALAMSPDGSRLYFSNFFYSVAYVDLSSGKLRFLCGSSNTDIINGVGIIARFNNINTLYADSAGTFLYIGEPGRVRRVNISSTVVSTLAGGGGTVDNNISADQAYLDDVISFCGIRQGKLYFMEADLFTIREVHLSSNIIRRFIGNLQRNIQGEYVILSNVTEVDSMRGCHYNEAFDVFYVAEQYGDVTTFSFIPSRVRSVAVVASPTSQPSSQPSRQPSSQPTRQPSTQPTCLPTNHPTCLPTCLPTSQPSSSPSYYRDSMEKLVYTQVGFNKRRSLSMGNGEEAISARINTIRDFTLDADNNLILTDELAIRKYMMTTQEISLVAGGGSESNSGDGWDALQAFVCNVRSVTLDTFGNIYYVESDLWHRVRMLTKADNIIRTVVGSNVKNDVGFGGDGGDGTNARLNRPYGVQYDLQSHSLYISDWANNRVRAWDISADVVSTIVGDGTNALVPNAFTLSTGINGPVYVWKGMDDYFYIAEYYGCSVLRYRRQDQIVTRFAGTGACVTTTTPNGPATTVSLMGAVAVCGDTSGNVYIVSQLSLYHVNISGYIRTITGSQGRSGASGIDALSFRSGVNYGCAVHPGSGDLYFSTVSPNLVRVVSPLSSNPMVYSAIGYTGNIIMPANKFGALHNIVSMWVDTVGNIYFIETTTRVNKVDKVTQQIVVYAGISRNVGGNDNIQATLSGLSQAFGVTGDIQGNIYISEYGSNRIRKVATNGIITTIAGKLNEANCFGALPASFVATSMGLCRASGLAMDTIRNELFYIDVFVVYKLSFSTGMVTLVNSVWFDQLNSIRAADFTSSDLNTTMIWLHSTSGNLYIADTKHSVVVRMSVLGNVNNSVVSIVAGSLSGNAPAYSTEDTPATSIEFGEIRGICGDSDENLFVSQQTSYRILQIKNTSGRVLTYLGTGQTDIADDFITASSTDNLLGIPVACMVDSVGDMYYAEHHIGFANREYGRIRRVTSLAYPSSQPTSQPSSMPSGQGGSDRVVNTIAGYTAGRDDIGDNGPALAASLDDPKGIHIDDQGNYYVIEASRIRRIDALTKTITTVVGGGYSPSDDGLIGRNASIVSGWGLTGDNQNGVLYYSDTDACLVRKYIIATDEVYTVAGIFGMRSPPSVDVPAIEVRLNVGGVFYHASSNRLYIVENVQSQILYVSLDTGYLHALIGTSGMDGYMDGPAGIALLKYPRDVWADDARNLLYIADCGNNVVRVFNFTTNETTTFAGDPFALPYDGEDVDATSGGLYMPSSVCGDAMGNVYVVSFDVNFAIRKIDSDGIISTIVRSQLNTMVVSGFPVTGLRMGASASCKVDLDGSLVVTDISYSAVWHLQAPVSPSSVATSVVKFLSGSESIPATSVPFYSTGGMWYDAIYGTWYFTDYGKKQVYELHEGEVKVKAGLGVSGGTSSTSGNALTTQLEYPFGITGDSFGSVYFTDYDLNVIFQVAVDGSIIVVAGNGQICQHSVTNDVGSMSVSLCHPIALAFDGLETIYFSEMSYYIKKLVVTSYTLFNVAGTGSELTSISSFVDNSALLNTAIPAIASMQFLDADTLIYVDSVFNIIRVVLLSSNQVKQYAGSVGKVGGSAQENVVASQSYLHGLYAVCHSGTNVYIAIQLQGNNVTNRNTIKVMSRHTTRVISFAGSDGDGTSSYGGEFVAATSAVIGSIRSCVVDTSGNVYYAEAIDTPSGQQEARIRKVSIEEISPISQPSSLPSRQPTSEPTSQPSTEPSRQPTTQPSKQPTSDPSCQPSSQPSRHPTDQPTAQPSYHPSSQPTRQPTIQPTRRPTNRPSSQPSCQPSTQPSGQPTPQPTWQPSTQPSMKPTVQPSCQLSSQPSSQPSMQSTRQPSCQPSSQPTTRQSCQPSAHPSAKSAMSPAREPSSEPSSHSTCQPVIDPTIQPSSQPSAQTSRETISQPTNQPTSQPSSQPVLHATVHLTCQPSLHPITEPLPLQPSIVPSAQPIRQPSSQPTTQLSYQPSVQPSCTPTAQPSKQPTSMPVSEQSSMQPSGQPSRQPSPQPTNQSPRQPTSQPSRQPISQYTRQPSTQPSRQPSSQPTTQPSTKSYASFSPQPTFSLFAPQAPSTSSNTSTTNASLAISVLDSLTSSQSAMSLVTDSVRVLSQTMSLLLNSDSKGGGIGGSSVRSVQLPLSTSELALQQSGVVVTSVPSISLNILGASAQNSSSLNITVGSNSSLYVAVILLDSSMWSTPTPRNNSNSMPQAGQLQTNIVAISIVNNGSSSS
ncbi:hypothetical protein EON65_09835, partial [archaeon]